jgi:magnesium-protoporphyrin O-methyltransferase
MTRGACDCDAIAAMFDADTARRDLERYRRDGPDLTTRQLLDLLRDVDVLGASILDIGAGIGAIDHELLREGAAHAVLADGSLDYLAAARDEGRRRGQLDRMDFIDDDFVTRATSVDRADIVTLDRTVCCYPDLEALLGTAATKADRWLGLVLPRDRWLNRAVVGLENRWYRLRRNPYRFFAHPNHEVDHIAAAAGLRPWRESGTYLWRVVLYGRATPDFSPP